MLMAPIKQGEGAIEHESPTGLIRFHQRLNYTFFYNKGKP